MTDVNTATSWADKSTGDGKVFSVSPRRAEVQVTVTGDSFFKMRSKTGTYQGSIVWIVLSNNKSICRSFSSYTVSAGLAWLNQSAV